VSIASPQTASSAAKSAAPAKPRVNAREAMESLNAEAGKFNIWLRTQANAPAQRPWFRDTGIEAGGTVAAGRVGANQIKTAPHRWRWREIGPYLDRIAEIARNSDVPPIEFADRQQFLLTNPGLGGRLQVTNTIRCAISIYNPGDVAPVHIHTPNASRTILSEHGGYTVVEGERCAATASGSTMSSTASAPAMAAPKRRCIRTAIRASSTAPAVCCRASCRISAASERARRR
jgi:hypothetical protein